MRTSRMPNGISKVMNNELFVGYVAMSAHIDFSAVNNALKYDCCPTLYPFVLFTIRIRRRSLYYVTNVVGKISRTLLEGTRASYLRMSLSLCSTVLFNQLSHYSGFSSCTR